MYTVAELGLKRHAALRDPLWAFKEQLEVERDTDVVLKAWEIKDIGLQAVARIKSSQTPLLALMRLSQNFPAHVAGLARSSVPEKLRKNLPKLRQIIRETSEVFSVNSRLVRHANVAVEGWILVFQQSKSSTFHQTLAYGIAVAFV